MKPSEILRKVKIGRDNYLGICTSFYLHPDSDLELVLVMKRNGISFNQWEHFSGDYNYPVPARCPRFAYVRFNKWSRKSKYGQMRWQLLDWLIDQFENKGA